MRVAYPTCQEQDSKIIDAINEAFRNNDVHVWAYRDKYITLYADTLLKFWGLRGASWRFKFNTRAKKRVGQCDYDARTIELSYKYVEAGISWAQMDETIRHEIAHALAGPWAKHGPEWKAWARKVGATPKACADIPKDQAPKSKYLYASFFQDGSIRVWDQVKGPERLKKNLHNLYLKGKRNQTAGVLWLIDRKDYEAGRISPRYLKRTMEVIGSGKNLQFTAEEWLKQQQSKGRVRKAAQKG